MISIRGLKCDETRHLKGSGLELAIHSKLQSLTWVQSRKEYGEYHKTIQMLADFFGVLRESASRAVGNLHRKGWVEFIGKGKKKHIRPVAHDEWVSSHGSVDCYVCDATPWDGEAKDLLALALHRESHGNVKWYPNMLKGLRKTGASDAEIESAYHEHVAALDHEPKHPKAWQANAWKFAKKFRDEHATEKVISIEPNDDVSEVERANGAAAEAVFGFGSQ